MKVTIAQLNPTVGDISGNQAKIARVLSQTAAECPDLVVFSELFLVGYPPQDLVERPWFIKKVQEAVEELCALSQQYPETGILVGAPLPTGRTTGKGLFNSAVLIYQGKILLNQPKSLLPTYDVFDEARYFNPAPSLATVSFKGETLGISICEDAWNEPDFWPLGRMYDLDPIAKLAGLGASILINISASPFHMGKEELRYRLIQNHAGKHRLPFLFVNQVGGNDELIFDGGSMFFDRSGEPAAFCRLFEEEVKTVETGSSGILEEYRPVERIESVYQALILGIRDYLRKCGFHRAVVGLSGGIDSALTACLAVEALGKENVLGITMPSCYSSEGSVTDSQALARNLGIEFQIIPIAGIYDSYLGTLEQHFAGKTRDVTEENIQARIRGNILMGFSNKFGYLALSTGNKSEMAVGYCTLYGDMSGGLSVISDVPKTMVYELAGYVNRATELIPRAIIEKAPSAELRPDQRDEDTLPPYPILDRILYYYIEEGYSVEDLIGLNLDPETVQWVVRTVDRNEYKRKQAAPGLKVTSKAFGVGRRMPVAKKLDY